MKARDAFGERYQFHTTWALGWIGLIMKPFRAIAFGDFHLPSLPPAIASNIVTKGLTDNDHSPAREVPGPGRRRARPLHRLSPGARAHGARQGQRGRRPRPRQDRGRRRRFRDRLRGHSQQLLPAGDARADGRVRGGLGERRRGLTAIIRSATCRSAPNACTPTSPTSPRSRRRSATTPSFIEGEADCMRYMRGMFDDWQAKGITSVLHEKKGGYANNTASMHGLAAKAQAPGRAHHDRGRGDRLPDRLELGCHHRRSRRRAGRSSATRRDRRRSVDSQDLGQCWTCRPRSTSRAATASSTATFRCGPIGASRKARSASIPSSASPMTARWGRSSMSTPTRRFIPTSTVR